MTLGFVVFLATLTPWMMSGVATEDSFERVRATSEQNRRCIACAMNYPSYRALTWTTVLGFNGVFGLASFVGLRRAFGPPAMSLSSDGRGRYRGPWRRRDFSLGPRVSIKVTPYAIHFDPPAKVGDDPRGIGSINIQLMWTGRSAASVARDLQVLNPGWKVSS
ncbi:hypothetical protein [uncultured Brevundimonas sp.]|uniref:hypothetical protein n=1 Tax=uncultured Brevundimonas sp. TaxID=213418 RepID=UPI0025D335AA|nr:hypothetical protein [uncultured Brevundimonas sp.]